MFNYEVLNEQDSLKAREFQLLKEGIYDFAVLEAKLAMSQAGNHMIKLKIQIIHEGQDFNVFDNLIATTNMTWKTKHFCDTTGLEEEYLSGKFNQDLALRRRGKCMIGYVGATPKNDGSGGMWKAKNEVLDYLSTESKASNPFAPPVAIPATQPPVVDEFIDDDLPF